MRFAILLLSLSVPVVASPGDDIKASSFDAKGVKIRFIAAGKGEPVVLIHGLHSSAELNWVAPGVLRGLAADHLVIAPDLPGHGGSDKPQADDAYGMQLVEDIALLLDHLKIKKTHVVGYSLGGIIALKFVAVHPDRAMSGTLGGMGWLREGSALQQVWDQMPVKDKDHARTPAACIKGTAQLALSEKDLKAIRIPITILVGDRDPVKGLYIKPLTVARPDWPVVEIERSGHISTLATKKFFDDLESWLAKNRQK